MEASLALIRLSNKPDSSETKSVCLASGWALAVTKDS